MKQRHAYETNFANEFEMGRERAHDSSDKGDRAGQEWEQENKKERKYQRNNKDNYVSDLSLFLSVSF